MVDEGLVDLVEKTAEFRGEDTVARGFIIKALEKIDSGEIDVVKYPLGCPSLKDVYKLALIIKAEENIDVSKTAQ